MVNYDALFANQDSALKAKEFVIDVVVESPLIALQNHDQLKLELQKSLENNLKNSGANVVAESHNDGDLAITVCTVLISPTVGNTGLCGALSINVLRHMQINNTMMWASIWSNRLMPAVVVEENEQDLKHGRAAAAYAAVLGTQIRK